MLSSDSPPKEIPTLQERLVSRFKWGLVTEIEPPCYETRMAILKRKSRERGRELPDDVARLLAEHIDSNIRELEGAVTKLHRLRDALGARRSRPSSRARCLRDLFAERTRPAVDGGHPATSSRSTSTSSSPTCSRGGARTRSPTRARSAMYLARQITRHSLEEIGGFFGGRDHSTVLYAIEKIERLHARGRPSCRALLGRAARTQLQQSLR